MYIILFSGTKNFDVCMGLMHANLLFFGCNSYFNQQLLTIVLSKCFCNLELKWTDLNTYYKGIDLCSSIRIHLTVTKMYGRI